jgi:hypothetical protein
MNGIMLRIIMLSVILSDIILSVIMLSVILSDLILSAIMLSVIILSAITLRCHGGIKWAPKRAHKHTSLLQDGPKVVRFEQHECKKKKKQF